MNYAPYLYEHERIFPLLFINNSGITGAESKRDSDPTPLMKDSNKTPYNKFLYAVKLFFGSIKGNATNLYM